ncbi:CNP1-like family protein [Paraburkholderia bonniea]|uniref:CNP1-like family protein n=1 Tax=Paraburkholderia bonniea TaxID=2152891 RepID=UPI001290C6B1|nr:CNP1-like family protein [Paraburkholderia bonniea]WJF89909.1 CNP1-like family protein [Paraburkholderia bonniea]WJF93223.1 CNP1-like family protein [Paraburkholderia bonniea]
MKALVFAAAVISAAALLAGCASKPSNKDDSAFTYLLDRPSNWVENKLEGLPPLPQANNLQPFNVSQNTRLQFSLDTQSLSVGTDGVVRYTVVITSPAGARNVNYEGIRCDTYSWRLYAGLDADHSGWDQTVANDWTRIENGELNAYHAALYQDYFCASKMPVGSAKQIIENMRYNRTNGNSMLH